MATSDHTRIGFRTCRCTNKHNVAMGLFVILHTREQYVNDYVRTYYLRIGARTSLDYQLCVSTYVLGLLHTATYALMQVTHKSTFTKIRVGLSIWS